MTVLVLDHIFWFCVSIFQNATYKGLLSVLIFSRMQQLVLSTFKLFFLTSILLWQLLNIFVTSVTNCFHQKSEMEYWITYTSLFLYSVVINELMDYKVLMNRT